jgi:hypothetical protein
MTAPITFALPSRRAHFRRLLAVGWLLSLFAFDLATARVSAAAPLGARQDALREPLAMQVRAARAATGGTASWT